MPANTTRGRSYTSFPRNTKQAYIKACADAAREAEKRAAQIEACYGEHTQGQMAWLCSDEVVTSRRNAA